MSRATAFPLGSAITLESLDRDPHPVLAELRIHEPVSWVPALEGWLVTRHDVALAAMRDTRRFTVDDPRFSTARVVGPSMLSLDDDEHARHRAAFVDAFRPRAVQRRFEDPVAADANRLLDALKPAGAAELRRAFAAPLAASVIARALGLPAQDSADVLRYYDAIVAAVTEITARGVPPAPGAAAFSALSARLRRAMGDAGAPSLLSAAASASDLSDQQIVSNGAVLLFGGIETTEGMLANALLHLLQNEEALGRVIASPELMAPAIEESLRLEPAAAVIDRYATAAAELAGVEIAAGDLVRISIASANRDPDIFDEPDRFVLERRNARRHLAFARGPHVCLGVHLARLEARTALAALLHGLPGLRLDPESKSEVRGLVFRKPQTLNVVWNT